MQKNKIRNVVQKEIFPGWLVWSVALIWGFVVLKNYFSIFKLNFDNLGVMLSPDQYLGIFNFGNLLIIKHLLNIILAAIFSFSAFGIGRFILKQAGLTFFNALEEFVFSIALGFGIISYFVFLVGVLGFLYSPVMYSAFLVFLVIGIIDLKKRPLKLRLSSDKLSALDILAVCILLIAALLNLTGALSPEIFYDSLVYHLGVPHFYKLHHGIVNMPYVFLSNLPAAASMLFTAGLLIKDEILAKLINYSAGILSCLVLLSISVRYFSLRTGIWAALIFYTITHVMIGSWSCGSEALLALFGLISLYAVINFADGKNGWLVLSAIFAGVAMGTKYTGLFVAAGVAAAYLFCSLPFSLKKLKNIILWAFIATAVVSPWLIKNYVYKKDPVYPYLSKMFPQDATSDYDRLNSFINEAKQFTSFNVVNWLKHPWDITMGKISNSEYFTPLFLFLLPLIIFFGKPPGVMKYLLVYFLVVWLTWSVSTTMIRFMMPAFPAAGLLVARYLKSESYKSLKNILLCVVLFCCITGVYWAGWIYYVQGGWKVVFGLQSKSDFLSSTHSSYPYGYYAAADFINKNLPADARILFIGEGRSFYIDRDPVVSSAQDLTPIVEFAKRSGNADELYRELKGQGITHIFFNLVEAIRLGRSYGIFNWDDRSLAVYNDFWKKYVKEIFSKDEIDSGHFINRVSVYEILNEKEAAIPHTPPLNLMMEIVLKNTNPKK